MQEKTLANSLRTSHRIPWSLDSRLRQRWDFPGTRYRAGVWGCRPTKNFSWCDSTYLFLVRDFADKVVR